jgi:hypothetical protein
MTCLCDGDLSALEALQANALARANKMYDDFNEEEAGSVPAICTINPYGVGATEAQKKCHSAETLIMLGKWFHCVTEPDPNDCFDGVCSDYSDAVDDCYVV